MNPNLGFLLSFVVFGTVLNGSAADDYVDAVELAQAGNSWKEGEPIPIKLLEYRSSHEDGSCFPNPRGTESLFGAITNYTLLREIAFLPEIDSRVFSNSVNNAVVIAGPNRFFRDLAAALKQHPELEKWERFRMIKKQSKVRHIVVDSLYITFADMVPDSARKVLNEISLEFQAGKPWHDVYLKFAEKYECPYEDRSVNGTINMGTRTKIGNLGDFVLPANRNALFSYRESLMPKEHIKKLFAVHLGDILILYDKEDLSRYPELAEKETGERYVLHRVREVYNGM
jgi:hypothetical protein